jgi:hypothetical protein
VHQNVRGGAGRVLEGDKGSNIPHGRVLQAAVGTVVDGFAIISLSTVTMVAAMIDSNDRQ